MGNNMEKIKEANNPSPNSLIFVAINKLAIIVLLLIE